MDVAAQAKALAAERRFSDAATVLAPQLVADPSDGALWSQVCWQHMVPRTLLLLRFCVLPFLCHITDSPPAILCIVLLCRERPRIIA